MPNPFNPCEDVMGYSWLRVFVWVVALAALCGNLFVILVLLTGRSKLTVSKFLMCNLSFADLLMGIYLLILACVDAHTLGEYFTHAVTWQNDGGCQVAGFLTVFASELSVFALVVITLERWYAISQAIHVDRRMRLRQAMTLMAVGWVVALTLAVMPLFGVSGYGAVSMCLPMDVRDVVDIVYVITILVFNGIAFTAITGWYISMFIQVKESENMARSNDATVAKRMAILVLTNFICWAPIAFFGLTASSGLPLIDITNSKILLVFFYPFNSCVNPFLYAILTKQFRRDIFTLLGRCGVCLDKANQYNRNSWSYPKNAGLHYQVNRQSTELSLLSQQRRGQRHSDPKVNANASRGGKHESVPLMRSYSDPRKTSPPETPEFSTDSFSYPTSPTPGSSGSGSGLRVRLSSMSKEERRLSTVQEVSHTSDEGINISKTSAALKSKPHSWSEESHLFLGKSRSHCGTPSQYVVLFKDHSSKQMLPSRKTSEEKALTLGEGYAHQISRSYEKGNCQRTDAHRESSLERKKVENSQSDSSSKPGSDVVPSVSPVTSDVTFDDVTVVSSDPRHETTILTNVQKTNSEDAILE